MQLKELRDEIQATGDKAAIEALTVSTRAIGNLLGTCKVAHCEASTEPKPTFAIYLVFPSASQDLPLVELRYAQNQAPTLSVRLVALEKGEVHVLSDNLAKDGVEQYAATWNSLARTTDMLGFMSPPEPNGAGMM